jgi:hypothetical protein
MTTCVAKLTPELRSALKAVLNQESTLAEQCNKYMKQFTEMSNELRLIHHEDHADECAHKRKQFIRSHASFIDCVNATSCDVTFKMIKVAAACDCMCIQSACFRVLHKWTPLLDRFRMKLLKIKQLCLTNVNETNAISNTVCDKIQKTVHKILRLKTTSSK